MEKNKRIIFMGTPKFASVVLEGLIENGYNIVGVISQPDKEVGRKKILTPTPVKEVALANNLKVIQPLKIRNDYQEILNLKPELIITCAYGQMIPKAILDYPKYHCINIHGSLLPKYRGGAPIQRCIINGEKVTGITIQYMAEKMDEGDILYARELEILPDDTNESLFERLSYLSKDVILEVLPILETIKPIKQDNDKATYAYNLSKEDEYINFNRSVDVVYNHIRGLLSNPGAFSLIEGKKIKFHKVSVGKEFNRPGEVLGLRNNKLAISCIDGSIEVELIQPEGKSVMPAKDFYNGQGKSLVGKCFEVFNGSKEN